MSDVLGTTDIRARVLAEWAASPARFREDANTEEDFALGGYRDRLVVELAQNAADAAAAAGVPGRLRLTLRASAADGPVLVAANTGAPLDAGGVQALSTMRATAKREPGATVGRFGVGFAAVLAVTDEPLLLSRTGGVRFSRDDTAELVAEAAAEESAAPGLGEELRRRAGHVPVLRLPFEAEGEPPEGFETAVVLPLRDEAAADFARRSLNEIDDALLLALPGLVRVEIDLGDGAERVLEGVDDRWLVHRAGGTWTAGERARLLADRPTEERDRPHWSVLWAIPRDPAADLPGVVHAPTPTDEPISLRALLIASFPLDPTRRHVATGPLTDRLVVEAASAFGDFLRDRAAAGTDVLPMVPTGLPAGALDGALRSAVLEKLVHVPLLPAIEDGTLVRPGDAVVIDGLDREALEVLAPVMAGLVAVPGSARAELTALGVRRMSLADLVDELAGVAEARTPEWWRELYESLAFAVNDPLTRDALGALPVPLADGRTVRGARGLLLPFEDIPEQALTVLVPYGLRIVHPAAASETLERLGALPATARTLLDEGAIRAAVEASSDAEDPVEVTEAVLALVSAARGELVPGALPWLNSLALPDAEGELAPAGELVLPGSSAQQLLDPEDFAAVDEEVVSRWGEATLEAAGVLRTFGLVTANDVDPAAPPDALDDLPDVDAWLASLDEGAVIGEVVAIRDLDCVREDAWPAALQAIAAEPELRRALLTEPSYPAWWIREELGLDGVADPEADQTVAAALPPAPEWVAGLDPELRSCLGAARRLADLEASGTRQLLWRLADPGVELAAPVLLEIWQHLGYRPLDDELPEPAPRVRVLDGTGSRLVPAEEAVVVDAPMWLQRNDLGGVVAARPETAEALAELFDLELATEQVAGKVDQPGTPAEVAEVVRLLLPEVPTSWREHDDLAVDGQPVDWWVDASGNPHAATTEGLARALAWAAGAWSARHQLALVLTDPDQVPAALAETAYD